MNPGIPQPDDSAVDENGIPQGFSPGGSAPPPSSPPPPPPSTPQPVANSSAIKGLLTNFFGGMGSAMMVHAGLPTPEQEQQRQQQFQLQKQQADSMEGLRQAQQAAAELHPYQMPAAPDGTPGAIINTNAAGIKDIQLQQLKNAAKPGLQMSTIGPEHAQLLPGIPVGTQVPKALLDKALLSTASRQAIQNNAPEKTPTQIALEVRRDQGDPQAARILDRMQAEKMAQANARGAASQLNRVLPVINPDTGEMGFQMAGKAVSQGLAPAVQGGQVMSKQAQFGEMKSASSKLRDSISNLDRDFTPSQIAKLQLAARAPDESVLRTVIDSTLGTENLTPAQQDYVIWLGQMNERLLSLRNVAGMGQGSQDLRSAIQATLPNLKSGSKEFALKKMDAVDNQIQTLERGIPKFKGGAKGSAQGGGRRPTHRFNPATGKIEVIP